jgi:hypothetical protein
MILTVNMYYFLKQHQQVEISNGEVWCFICGTDWILEYYLDELRLQRVEKTMTSLSARTLQAPVPSVKRAVPMSTSYAFTFLCSQILMRIQCRGHFMHCASSAAHLECRNVPNWPNYQGRLSTSKPWNCSSTSVAPAEDRGCWLVWPVAHVSGSDIWMVHWWSDGRKGKPK